MARMNPDPYTTKTIVNFGILRIMLSIRCGAGIVGKYGREITVPQEEMFYPQKGKKLSTKFQISISIG
jgi:hypothetical protein